MNVSLNSILAERATLIARLAQLEDVIANIADATPVEIETTKNLRNSAGVTWIPEDADRLMVVYADEALTTPADKSDHGGWVSKVALAAYKLEYPHWQEILRVLE